MFDWGDHFAYAGEKWKGNLMSEIDGIDMLIFLPMHRHFPHFNLHAR